jgi:hypothetical protein
MGESFSILFRNKQKRKPFKTFYITSLILLCASNATVFFVSPQQSPLTPNSSAVDMVQKRIRCTAPKTAPDWVQTDGSLSFSVRDFLNLMVLFILRDLYVLRKLAICSHDEIFQGC